MEYELLEGGEVVERVGPLRAVGWKAEGLGEGASGASLGAEHGVGAAEGEAFAAGAPAELGALGWRAAALAGGGRCWPLRKAEGGVVPGSAWAAALGEAGAAPTAAAEGGAAGDGVADGEGGGEVGRVQAGPV